MLRRLPLLAFALLPAAVAAPVPPGARPEFGATGLLTRADLEKVRFDSRRLTLGKETELEGAKRGLAEARASSAVPAQCTWPPEAVTLRS